MKRWGKSMFNEYVARVTECEQKAKTARNQDDKHSWLAMAASWRKTAELQLILERQALFIQEASSPRAPRF
jgi:putative IMPACT (imprinted ancient) family translation regulator